MMRTLRAVAPALALAIGLALYIGKALAAGGPLGFPLDDAWIHLTLARSFAETGTFAINAGDAVGASTAPLWTLLLVPIVSALDSAVIAVHTLSALLTLVGLEATRRLYLAYRPRAVWSAAAAGVVVALLPSTIWGALSGLEVSLSIALSALALWSNAKRGGIAGSLLIGLATAARPEALVLWPLAMLVNRRQSVSALGARLAALALPLLPLVVLNLTSHGAPLPTTFYAKIHQSRNMLGGQGLFWAISTGHFGEGLALFYHWSFVHLAMFWNALLETNPLLLLAAGAGVVEGLRRRRSTLRLPALAVLAVPLAIGIVTPRPDFGAGDRYIAFLNPALAVLAVAGAAPLLRRIRARAGTLLLCAVAIPTTLALVRGADFYADAVDNTERMHVALGRWMAENLPKDASVAVHDIGALSFFGRQRLLDLEGIGSPEMLAHKHDPNARYAALYERRPDYLIVAPNWYPDLVRHTDVFAPIHVQEIPPAENRVLAGPQMVVFRATWPEIK